MTENLPLFEFKKNEFKSIYLDGCGQCFTGHLSGCWKQYVNADKRILIFALCLIGKYLPQRKEINVCGKGNKANKLVITSAGIMTNNPSGAYNSTHTNNNWFQTVTEDKQNAAPEHNEVKAALCGQIVFHKKTWGGAVYGVSWWYCSALFPPFQMSPIPKSDEANDSRGPTQILLALKRGSFIQLSVFFVFFFILLQSHRLSHLCQVHQEETQQVQKLRQSSCSALPTDQPVLEQ